MISFNGLNNLTSALQQKTQEMADEALNIIAETGDNIYQDSQSAVPVDEGRLKESGRIIIEQSSTTIDVEITYGDGEGYGSKYGIADGYSWFQQLGTSKMGAQPYLQPQFDDNTNTMIDKLENLISQ
jgi:HK97 gp10 family phage protein